jgi:hypothetical protein
VAFACAREKEVNAFVATDQREIVRKVTPGHARVARALRPKRFGTLLAKLQTWMDQGRQCSQPTCFSRMDPASGNTHDGLCNRLRSYVAFPC